MSKSRRELLAAPLWGLRPASNDKLVELYRKYADKVVSTVCRKRPALARHKDDCIGNAYLALVKCVQSYDPSNGATFVTYVHPRLWGACLDVARRNDWVPHTARSNDTKRRREDPEYAHIPDMQPLGETQIRVHSNDAEEQAIVNEKLDGIKIARHRQIIANIREHGIEKAAKLDGSSVAACEMVARRYCR